MWKEKDTVDSVEKGGVGDGGVMERAGVGSICPSRGTSVLPNAGGYLLHT